MQVTRRHVLAALAAVPAISAAGAGLAWWNWWDRAPAPDLQALSPDEYAFLQAMAEAWMPPGGAVALSGADADCGRYVDSLVARLPSLEKRLVKALIQILDDRPRIPHLYNYSSLDLETRTTILAAWLDSSIPEERTAVNTLLLLVGDAYGTHPDVVKSMQDCFGCGYGR